MTAIWNILATNHQKDMYNTTLVNAWPLRVQCKMGGYHIDSYSSPLAPTVSFGNICGMTFHLTSKGTYKFNNKYQFVRVESITILIKWDVKRCGYLFRESTDHFTSYWCNTARAGMFGLIQLESSILTLEFVYLTPSIYWPIKSYWLISSYVKNSEKRCGNARPAEGQVAELFLWLDVEYGQIVNIVWWQVLSYYKHSVITRPYLCPSCRPCFLKALTHYLTRLGSLGATRSPNHLKVRVRPQITERLVYSHFLSTYLSQAFSRPGPKCSPDLDPTVVWPWYENSSYCFSQKYFLLFDEIN